MINVAMLRESFHLLRRRAASGVDGQSVADYESDLEMNLAGLLERLKSKSYRAKLVRGRYIPKADGKLRPLGIPAVEDKIVQMSARRILESIYEADFTETSWGYRRGKGAREAGGVLREALLSKKVNWVVEADIKSFFTQMDHRKLLKMLPNRIDDEAFVRLIGKWLSAGVLEEDGRIVHPETGIPQGGIVSPVLANVYLHHVLDMRIESDVKSKAHADVVYLRYADDFVCGFYSKKDADRFLLWLRKQLACYGLELAEEKSAVVKFTRFDVKGSGRLGFLGFVFFWSETRKGKKTVRMATHPKRLNAALQAMKQWVRRSRNLPLSKIVPLLRSKLVGHYNYYGVLGNARSLGRYRHGCQRLLYKWLNRRSQKRSYDWDGFCRMWTTMGLPEPKLNVKPCQPILEPLQVYY
ncbi:MAG: group II intron reverse transcriptase/maturase [Verrucomicrobiota bacterium]